LNYSSVVPAFLSTQSQILDKVHSFSSLSLVHQRVIGLNIITASSGYCPEAAAPSYYLIKTEPMESSSWSYFYSVTIFAGFDFSSTN
jgi:hypothetical protein